MVLLGKEKKTIFGFHFFVSLFWILMIFKKALGDIAEEISSMVPTQNSQVMKEISHLRKVESLSMLGLSCDHNTIYFKETLKVWKSWTFSFISPVSSITQVGSKNSIQFTLKNEELTAVEVKLFLIESNDPHKYLFDNNICLPFQFYSELFYLFHDFFSFTEKTRNKNNHIYSEYDVHCETWNRYCCHMRRKRILHNSNESRIIPIMSSFYWRYQNWKNDWKGSVWLLFDSLFGNSLNSQIWKCFYWKISRWNRCSETNQQEIN